MVWGGPGRAGSGTCPGRRPAGGGNAPADTSRERPPDRTGKEPGGTGALNALNARRQRITTSASSNTVPTRHTSRRVFASHPAARPEILEALRRVATLLAPTAEETLQLKRIPARGPELR